MGIYCIGIIFPNSLLTTSKFDFGGVTNRFYFSFLNDAQWRVIGRAIRRTPVQPFLVRGVGFPTEECVCAHS